MPARRAGTNPPTTAVQRRRDKLAPQTTTPAPTPPTGMVNPVIRMGPEQMQQRFPNFPINQMLQQRRQLPQLSPEVRERLSGLAGNLISGQGLPQRTDQGFTRQTPLRQPFEPRPQRQPAQQQGFTPQPQTPQGAMQPLQATFGRRQVMRDRLAQILRALRGLQGGQGGAF